jgi:hypothetical protein
MATPPNPVPPNPEPQNNSVQSVLNNLGAVFRHLVPGVLIMGAVYVARRAWFPAGTFDSWQHLTVVGVIALAVGNIWFVLNRYAFHQLVDWILYLCRVPGPPRSGGGYRRGLGTYVTNSLYWPIPDRARQHVTFRASAVLLMYTVGLFTVCLNGS